MGGKTLKLNSNSFVEIPHLLGRLILRRAVENDIESLIGICRTSFPDVLKRRKRAWWEYIIKVDFCEVWVCELDSKLIGVAQLITDQNLENDKNQKICFSRTSYLQHFICHPKILVEKIYEKLSAVLVKDTFYKERDELQAMGKKPLWIKAVALLPNMRSNGIGTAILGFCQQRALELRCDCIKLIVKKSNKRGLCLYERLGFIKTSSDANYYTYTKSLKNEVC
ncbi:MAG: GNAT family N-acetyltransferase [Sedimentisphaerales bacterium]|nr:GNAT family N-acetyltransferase [Sedimentisphaerales bacterium]